MKSKKFNFSKLTNWVKENGIIYCCGYIFRKIFRNRWQRARLKNSNFTIISQNCVGGMISHDLGQRFNSPTVNLFIKSEDYLCFLENLHDCIGQQLCFVNSDMRFPKATLRTGKGETISLYFPHENDLDLISNNWLKRSKRVNWSNLYIIATDRDGFNENFLERFDKLPYHNKILLSHKNYDKYDFIQFYKMYENQESVTPMIKIISIFGKREYEVGWDYIGWLNKNENKKNVRTSANQPLR